MNNPELIITNTLETPPIKAEADEAYDIIKMEKILKQESIFEFFKSDVKSLKEENELVFSVIDYAKNSSFLCESSKKKWQQYPKPRIINDERDKLLM